MYATRPDPIPPNPRTRPRSRPQAAGSLAPGSRSPQKSAVRSPRPSQGVSSHQRQVSDRATEACIKLSLNTLLVAAFGSALWHLVPYHQQQRVMLQQAETDVTAAEERVSQLQLNFSQVFDPKQARAVMQDQSYLVDPSQRRVIWLENSQTKTVEPPAPSQR